VSDSYYGQPVIKEPVWTWEIPCYFFTGGLAGASAGLAYLAGLQGEAPLARRSWLTALGAVTASPALLTMDLGKPTRFVNMLRVFKVTSPMSVGSWILTASGATTALSAAHAWTGLWPGAARVARPAAAVLGLPLSTYTAALAANTAVPVWHEARRTLPFVFASGAAASAGAVALMVAPASEAAPARRIALAGAVGELATTQLMEHRLGSLGEPYHSGTPGKLGRLAKGLTAAGAAAVVAGARRAGAAMIVGGAFAERWSIFKAGFASAADPKYVVGPQRERIERGETRGASRREPRVTS
jgi:Polysulphide reductase, NrfD